MPKTVTDERRFTTQTVEFRAAAADDDTLGTIHGYAAVFNEDTVIDSWEGRFVERIAPGAFKKTIAERRDQIKVLFNHGQDPSIGDKPLGKLDILREDQTGLYMSVRLVDTSYNRDLIALVRAGALHSQSFRFSVIRDNWDKAKNPYVRTLKEVKLYELGPVTFPAYEKTTASARTRQLLPESDRGLTPQAAIARLTLLKRKLYK